MSDRKMCYDCPHKREHEVGDVIALIPDDSGKLDKPHRCHNATSLPCVGAQMQLNKIKLNVVQIEDYETQIWFDPKTGVAKIKR